ncbi:hypothetical protein K466DRAFT_481813 [Polyporus arcularius HHB13444]|uniref:Uncharacterized protein n=1 Tax=Polyporus arcularius HHB13444 TaxID=1314778 RepID=A0A5C3PTB6_9APHY|nr:hypothetical protein K466DRAFT_481813 [Polyporus arcularius HHB13444]
MNVPAPPPESLAHRARLAALVSELRPTHFRAPLTRLRAHRLPTLWTLYRGLMRDAPTEMIRSRIRVFFHSRKALRAQGDVTRELRTAHKWWDVFRKARAGDAHLQAVCARYSRMLEGARAQTKVDKVYDEELAWYERMRTRPIMTGAYLRPSLYNGPLPRLVPQPLHITGMITSRRKARVRRMARHEACQEDLTLLNAEGHFERALTVSSSAEGTQLTRVFTDDPNGWREPIKQTMDSVSEAFQREKARLNAPYPSEMLEAIKEARREKIRNKTREGERERRGEMTNRLSKRMRQGPPAHVLALMTDEQRRMDRVARGASEVGYVGHVKRRLGFRLRDGEAGKVELGQPENRETLDNVADEIAQENERRRASSEAGS